MYAIVILPRAQHHTLNHQQKATVLENIKVLIIDLPLSTLISILIRVMIIIEVDMNIELCISS